MKAGYESHIFDDGTIDMHGVAIKQDDVTKEQVSLIKILEMAKMNRDMAETITDQSRWEAIVSEAFQAAGKPTMADIDNVKSSPLWK